MSEHLLRHLVLRGATGKTRLGTFAGEDYLIVPVVALVADIAIWPVNAPAPELVPLEALVVAPAGWNGRPVCDGHPKEGSANTPAVLEAYKMGEVFNAAIDGAKLVMEAWVNIERTRKLGGTAAETLARLEGGETVEVSVGCFVVAELRAGVDGRGKRYEAVWSEVVPDHLALLPAGQVGACSVDAGCGAQRAATVHLVTAEGTLDWTEEPKMAREIVDPKTTEEAPKRSLRERLLAQWKALVKSEAESLENLYGGPSRASLLAAGEMTDVELRGMLFDALKASEPGFLWIEAVETDAQNVIYCADPEGEMWMFRRGFTVSDGKATLSAEKDRVKPKMSYEAVNAEGAGAPAAAAGAEPAAEPKAAAGCGCGGGPSAKTAKSAAQSTTISDGGAMEKADRIKALIANPRTPWAEADQKYLEGVTDERLAELEQNAKDLTELQAKPAAEPVKEPVKEPVQAAAAPEQSEEDWLKTAPQSVRKLIADNKRRDAEQRSALVTVLTQAQQEYTKDELMAMETSTLERLVKLIGADEGQPVDFTGRGLPRVASTQPAELPNGWARKE